MSGCRMKKKQKTKKSVNDECDAAKLSQRSDVKVLLTHKMFNKETGRSGGNIFSQLFYSVQWVHNENRSRSNKSYVTRWERKEKKKLHNQ